MKRGALFAAMVLAAACAGADDGRQEDVVDSSSTGAAGSTTAAQGDSTGLSDAETAADSTSAAASTGESSSSSSTSVGDTTGSVAVDCDDLRPEVLFCDDFESGDLSYGDSGISWFNDVNTSVEAGRSAGGSHALAFAFKAATDPGNGQAPDAWAEQRLDLGGPYDDLWFRFDLYIPENFRHETQVDGPGNNKLLALYHSPYSTSGYSANFTSWPLASDPQGSEVCYTTLMEQSQWTGHEDCAPFVTGSDFGWRRIVMHFAAASDAGDDGVMELRVNDEIVIFADNVRSYGGESTNFFDEAYVLGWSNSGFAEATTLLVDNFAIATADVF